MVLPYWHIATAVVALNAVASFAAPVGVGKPLPPIPAEPLDVPPPPATKTKTLMSRVSGLGKALKKDFSTYPVSGTLKIVGALTGVAVGSASLWHAYHHRRDVTELEDSNYGREFKDELD